MGSISLFVKEVAEKRGEADYQARRGENPFCFFPWEGGEEVI